MNTTMYRNSIICIIINQRLSLLAEHTQLGSIYLYYHYPSIFNSYNLILFLTTTSYNSRKSK